MKYTKGKGNLSFGSVKGPKGLTDELYGFISREKVLFLRLIPVFKKRQCIYSSEKGSAKFYTKYMKGIPFVNRRYRKGIPFS